MYIYIYIYIYNFYECVNWNEKVLNCHCVHLVVFYINVCSTF